MQASGLKVLSATKATAVAPAHVAGALDVQATTAFGTSAVSAGDKFTYGVLPTVTGVSPLSGPPPPLPRSWPPPPLSSARDARRALQARLKNAPRVMRCPAGTHD